MKRHWKSIFFLLGPCMVYGWLVSGLLIWAMIPGLTYLSSIVISACLSPTDPILAQAVVGGKFADKHVPSHIRHLLSAESGCNDGAAFPFLYIALFLTLDRSAGHAVGEWFYYTWVYEIIMGTLIGALLGWVVRKVMQFSERKKIIDRQSFVAQYVSLAILSIGICTLLGSDDLLAAFACGTAFAWDGAFNKATEDSMFSNVIDLLFNCACFIYIGAIIPFKDFGNAAFHLSVWRLIVLAILILLLRRMPVILALYKFIPDLKTFREAVFVGWFGPMGVGAIFIATLARHHIPEPVNDGDTSQVDLLQETIVPIVSMLVLASVLTHGLSIPFFVTGRRVHTLTYTWSRNPSIATNNEPAWTTHARRIIPGQDVEINRDEEEGDIGLHNRMEKSSQGDSTESSNSNSNSQTRTWQGQGERITEKRTRDGEDHVQIVDDGAGTPPIAEYREGRDLVIEHRDGTDDCDVTTHVVKNAFHDRGEPHSKLGEAREVVHNIIHSRPGSRSSKRSRRSHHSGHSMTPVASIDSEHHGDGFVRRQMSDGRNIVELPPQDSPRRAATPPSPKSGPPVIVTDHAYGSDSEHSTNAGSDYEESGGRRPYAHLQRPSVSSSREEPSVSHTQSTRDSLPHVHSYIPADRLAPKKETGWRRFLGVGRKPHSSHHAAEEGRARPSTSDSDDGGFKRVPTTRSVHRTATLDPNEGGSGIPLTRTLSRAISFAPDAAPSSDTAPTIGNYGNTAPGFKRNPDLSLFRSSSIRFADDEDEDDNGGGQSVSFAEPKK